MTVTALPVGHVYTWVDVDDHLARLAEQGVWPSWLLECDAYWDALEMSVEPGATRSQAVKWLSSAFGPNSIRRADDDPELAHLVLDDVPGAPSQRLLSVAIVEEPETDLHRVPRWRERRVVRQLSGPLPAPIAPFPDDVEVVALHSFKGGVGRTLHAVALADALRARGQRVLLVDGDLEAPGITWMYARSGRPVDFSYEDFLALLHSSTDGRPDEAVRLGRAYLPNQRVDGVVVLPSRRAMEGLAPARIGPDDLLTTSRSPYYLTESLAELARAVGAHVVVVDLRAGASELSASVLLDPRVHRVFVSTVSAQSLDGTAAMMRSVRQRAPRRSTDPSGRVILTQFRSTDSPNRIAEMAAPLVAELASADQSEDVGDTQLVDDASQDTDVIRSGFQEALLGLPGSWDGVVELVRATGLTSLMDPFAEDLDLQSDKTPPLAPLEDQMADFRRQLAEQARGLRFAESARSQPLLPTDPLRRLVATHRTQVPACVVTGAKGAGKTFTQLQMCFRKTWDAYAGALGVVDVTIQDQVVPVLVSQNLQDDVKGAVEEVRRAAAREPGEPTSVFDLRQRIKAGLTQNLDDRGWLQVWLSCLVLSLGAELTMAGPEADLVGLAARERRIFTLDGLEDVFQNVVTDVSEQRALRVLMTDCLEWLTSLRGRPFGLVVFVRSDLVRAAVPQNSAQLLDRYRDYALRWDQDEAVRLAVWVALQAGTLPGLDEQKVVAAEDDDLSEQARRLWGDKMGTERSREARSQNWFLAALSDFNGDIQARDVVTFIGEAADHSTGWPERLLAPEAMRDALVECSRQKIEAIREEAPMVGTILEALRALPASARQVPFQQGDVHLSLMDIGILENSGVIFREGDAFWIPEIFRHGLGFKATGRPRVLAIANLVRRRNNRD